jgi:hypothetical protein
MVHGGKKALFLLKNLELLNRSSDVGEPFYKMKVPGLVWILGAEY